MKIQEFAKKVGLNAQTIRYYEKIGLLTTKRNKENLYRIYTDEDIKRILFIKKLKTLHFSLKEIKVFLRYLDQNHICEQFEILLKDQLEKIDSQIKELQSLKKQLHHFLLLCKKNSRKSHCISLEEEIKIS